jgi:hypothetical protein
MSVSVSVIISMSTGISTREDKSPKRSSSKSMSGIFASYQRKLSIERLNTPQSCPHTDKAHEFHKRLYPLRQDSWRPSLGGSNKQQLSWTCYTKLTFGQGISVTHSSTTQARQVYKPVSPRDSFPLLTGSATTASTQAPSHPINHNIIMTQTHTPNHLVALQR